jgi:hypothetical protein
MVYALAAADCDRAKPLGETFTAHLLPPDYSVLKKAMSTFLSSGERLRPNS